MVAATASSNQFEPKQIHKIELNLLSVNKKLTWEVLVAISLTVADLRGAQGAFAPPPGKNREDP